MLGHKLKQKGKRKAEHRHVAYERPVPGGRTIIDNNCHRKQMDDKYSSLGSQSIEERKLLDAYNTIQRQRVSVLLRINCV